MSETINIGEIAEKLVADVFSYFFLANKASHQ